MLKMKYRSSEPIVASKQTVAKSSKQLAGLNPPKQEKLLEVKPKVSESSVQTEKVLPQHSNTKAESYKHKYENMLKQLNEEKEQIER
ncbi:unnamed protein product [Sphagnum balticum]